MSGVVISLNDEEEEDDVAGLLATDEEEEEDDNERGRSQLFQSSSGATSRRRRPRGLRKPYAAIRGGGTVAHLINTLIICCLFFGMGFTKSLLDGMTSLKSGPTSQTAMAVQLGFSFGFVIGGFLLTKLSRLFVLLLATLSIGITLTFVPWVESVWAVDTVYTIIGVCLAIILAGGNVMCLDYWGSKSGPYLQALHFCLSLGLLTGPFLIDPLSHTQVPGFVQKAMNMKVTKAPPPVTPSTLSLGQYNHGLRKRSPNIFMESPGFEKSDSRRSKRSVLGRPPGSRPGFGDPVIYGQPNIPRRIPVGNPYQPQGWDEDEQWVPGIDYENYGGPYGLDPAIGQAKPKKPPKKVINALKTIIDYEKGENITDDESSSQKTSSSTSTTSTTTTTTTTTTTSTTSQTSTTTIRTTQSSSTDITSKLTKTTKTLSEIKNNTDDDLTVEKVLENYGVAKPKVGFLLNAAYDICLAVILLVCLCYNPREPRSRQEEASGRRDPEGNRIFKSTLTMLLFFFVILHWGMFEAIKRVVPTLTTVTATAPYMWQLFMGSFTAARFAAMLLSTFIAPTFMLFGSMTIIVAGCCLLLFAPQMVPAAVWIGIIILAVGLSTLFPTSLAWCEKHIFMSANVVSIISSGLAMGELLVLQLLSRISMEANDTSTTLIGMSLLGASLVTFSLFLCAFLIVRKQGRRYGRPQASGYELANQEDMNTLHSMTFEDETIDDEDEEDANDDFELSEPRQLKSKN